MSFLSRVRTILRATRRSNRCGRAAKSSFTFKPRLELLENRDCPSSLAFSTYLGGSGNDAALAIAVDSAGNSYVGGWSASANFPVTAGAYDTLFTNANNTHEGFVAKFNPSGTLLWATYLGGSAGDQVQGIAVNGFGNVFVTGITTSTDFPTTLGAFQRSASTANSNAFVTELNASGSALIYSTYLGGDNFIGGDNGGANGTAIAVDSSGDAFVTGADRASGFPTTAGAYQTTLPASGFYHQAGFVTELNPTGSGLIYSTFLGGPNGQIQGSDAIALNSAGDVYVTGFTDATNFPTTAGAYQTTNATGGGFENWNAFVTELNPAGSGLVYSTYLGGSAQTYGAGIALDNSGYAYVAGYTESANFPTTPGAFQTAFTGGPRDFFVTKLNSSGTGLIYSTYLGGNRDTVTSGSPNSIAVDASGNVCVTGATNSTNFPTVNPLQSTFRGGPYDDFVSELNASGTGLNFSTYLGGNGDESAFGFPAVSVGGTGNIYVAGDTSSTNFPTANAFQPANAGGYDAFLAKISTASNQPPVANNFTVTATTIATNIPIVPTEASDPDGDTVTVTSVTQGTNGTVTINNDGSVTYTLTKYFSGTDTFTYTVNDGHGNTATATVTVQVKVPPAVGIAMVCAQVDALDDLNHGQQNSLCSKLDNALKSLDKGNDKAAINQLDAFLNEVSAFRKAGNLDPATADFLSAEIQTAIDLIP
jgi:hypothetical protein